MPEIMHGLNIHRPIDDVYLAITSPEGIRNWWTRDAALETKLGGTGEFGFFARRFFVVLTIAELSPPSRVTWQVTNAAWPGDTIAFDLIQTDQVTRLCFAHRGWARADQRYASATTRWGFYLLSLKQYLETGKGTPNPDDADL